MPINWKRRKYTPEEFTAAWMKSLSVAEVARELKCNYTGGGYLSLRNAADDLGLSSTHMTGRGWNVGTRYRDVSPARPLSEILVEHSTYTSSYSLKLRLFKEGIKERKCETVGCGITVWMGVDAPLALDHINGNKRDNRIENLRILCYNCHGLTETFGTRNIGRYSTP